MDNLKIRTIRTLIIYDVSDELFWYMARRNNATMGYDGDDTYICTFRLPDSFIDRIPEHLKAEYKVIRNRVKRSKYHRLEIHPTTLSDRWDMVGERDTFEKFMDAMENHQLYVWHG